jgi:hypothetical protein
MKCFNCKVLKGILFFLIIVSGSNVLCQNDSINIWKPYLLSNHPLGIFTSRINHNFNSYATSKLQISFTISRGNVWLPEVVSNHLINKTDQDFFSEFLWHEKEYHFNLNPAESKQEILMADGVFSSYYLQVSAPISTKSDFNLSVKANQIVGGQVPYSLLTSDQLLEWFHTNIAGGEDPFGRKLYDFDQNKLFYQDKNGGTISIEDDQVFLTEVSFDTYYYPTFSFLEKHNIKMNTGLHTAGSFINSKMNFDLGLASTISKKIHTKKKLTITSGFSGSVLIPNIIKSSKVSINQNKALFSFESQWNFIRKIKPTRDFIFGINYHLQSAFQPTSELDNIVFTGERNVSHWHYAGRSLHIGIQGWSFIFSIRNKNFTYSTFFREDFVVDNAPDFQVGWGIAYKLN